MNSRFLILLALAIASVFADDRMMYQGLRLDFSALSLNRDILASIKPALNRVLHVEYHGFNESGSFFTHLYINKVRVTYFEIHEQRFAMNKFEYTYPIYKLKGDFESIFFHIEFHYEVRWLGIPINWGTAKGSVTNVNSEILVLWNETDPDVQIPHPWDIKNMTLTSWFAPTSWVTSLMHKQYIPVFHKAIDDAMFDFAHVLLKNYRYIEDVFPKEVDLVIRNGITTVKSSLNAKWFSIGFKTNVTVNQYLHKNLFRYMNASISAHGDFDYCFAATLVPDVYDVLGKGGYYDEDVAATTWGFKSNMIGELFDIMPSLRERYGGGEPFTIHCQTSRFETTNDLTTPDTPYPPLKMQTPEYCFIYVTGSSEYVLIVDIYFRWHYELKAKTNDTAFYGHVRSSDLYEFRTIPVLPESRKRILWDHVDAFRSHFSEYELMSPGLKIVPMREKELYYKHAYIDDEEICIYYFEKNQG